MSDAENAPVRGPPTTAGRWRVQPLARQPVRRRHARAGRRDVATQQDQGNAPAGPVPPPPAAPERQAATRQSPAHSSAQRLCRHRASVTVTMHHRAIEVVVGGRVVRSFLSRSCYTMTTSDLAGVASEVEW